MGWLKRFARPGPPAPRDDGPPSATFVESAVPGAAWIFARTREDRTHSVLDLGTASEPDLRLYGRYAQRVRFADLFAGGTRGTTLAALDTVPTQPEQPYDIIFAWNIWDWLSEHEGSRVVDRLTAITAPDARLHLVLEPAPEATIAPLEFTFLSEGRVRYRRPAHPPLPRRPLLPADVERRLEPFRIVRALTLKTGLREYVATREPIGP